MQGPLVDWAAVDVEMVKLDQHSHENWNKVMRWVYLSRFMKAKHVSHENLLRSLENSRPLIGSDDALCVTETSSVIPCCDHPEVMFSGQIPVALHIERESERERE